MATVANMSVADSLHQALKAGMSESTVESQHVRAIAVLTAQAAAAPQGDQAALNNAIALLNLSLAHVRDPKGH